MNTGNRLPMVIPVLSYIFENINYYNKFIENILKEGVVTDEVVNENIQQMKFIGEFAKGSAESILKGLAFTLQTCVDGEVNLFIDNNEPIIKILNLVNRYEKFNNSYIFETKNNYDIITVGDLNFVKVELEEYNYLVNSFYTGQSIENKILFYMTILKQLTDIDSTKNYYGIIETLYKKLISQKFKNQCLKENNINK